MDDTSEKKAGEVGPGRLGRNYDEVGPDLGRLHEAWHVDTGRPMLVLLPGERVVWQPTGPWQVRLSCQPKPPSVTLEVEQAPASVPVPELEDILVLMTAAVGRVEDNAQVQTHLAGAPVRPRERWIPRAAAAVCLLALDLGLWMHFEGAHGVLESTSGNRVLQSPSQTDAPDVAHTDDSQAPGISYPMPYEPFRNQAKAPCRADAGEVEINGGCWLALEQRPPCSATHAEHQGKCFIPVSKDRVRAPQSTQP